MWVLRVSSYLLDFGMFYKNVLRSLEQCGTVYRARGYLSVQSNIPFLILRCMGAENCLQSFSQFPSFLHHYFRLQLPPSTLSHQHPALIHESLPYHRNRIYDYIPLPPHAPNHSHLTLHAMKLTTSFSFQYTFFTFLFIYFTFFFHYLLFTSPIFCIYTPFYHYFLT